MKWLGFLKARLGERSTWMAIGLGVSGAAALVWPWSAGFLGVAIIAALIPEATKP